MKSTQKTKKCILMVRVSTEQQSYDAQMQELHELALASGYPEEDITPIAEKESGIKLSEEERSGLNRMKELIETGEYDCVFAWEISRIARRKKILFSISEYLTNRKIQLIIKEPSLRLLKDDGSIDEGAETTFTLFAQLAESEMRNKLARWKRAKDKGYAEGRYEGGRIALGYRINEQGYWEVDPENADLIRLIFQMYNSGEYSQAALAKELLSRGYFYKSVGDTSAQLSLHNTKSRISQILRNPIYIGQSDKTISGRVISTKNTYPRIIDDETWEKTCQKRAENRYIPKAKEGYLLTPLIRCSCGASYSGNAYDGSYTCRVKHAGTGQGLQHTPDIHGNTLDSLAWFIALQEFASDRASSAQELKAENEEAIDILHQKITQAEKNIQDIEARKAKLDEDFYVKARMSAERYETLCEKQNETITRESNQINNYASQIKILQEQIDNAITFDELFDSLRGQLEDLYEGTDMKIMKEIIRRYIKSIHIEPIEGKLSNYWKKVHFEMHHSEEREAQRKQLLEKGMEEAARILSSTFYVDIFHHIAYWDEDCQHPVPMFTFNHFQKKRVENRKNRPRKQTKNHQY